jgi:hypothetical protein
MTAAAQCSTAGHGGQILLAVGGPESERAVKRLKGNC